MRFIKEADLGRFELFDVSEDESETIDLAPSEPSRFESMKQKMIDLHAEIRREGPEYQLGSNRKKP